MSSTRMFFCDPPGVSTVDAIKNFGYDNDPELHYIWLHDQEPIHLDIHQELFKQVWFLNQDLHLQGPMNSGIITSEWNSEFVEKACELYEWDHHYYYFYHGWAALDWYRGYHRTWLMPDPAERKIEKSFISPNRIIGGKRDHRVLLLYHLFKYKVSNALISCPNVCPVEQMSIDQIGTKFKNRYSDIETVFQSADLPLHFANETDHPMHSCWLSLFDECAETLAYVVTETVFTGRRNHLTEKTFKPICQQMPFVLVSTAGSLRYLRQYGFKTFGDIWDESYDDELDDVLRLEKIAKLLHDLDSLSTSELQSLYQRAMPAIKHNYEHFYGGTFESLLWNELTGMLEQIKNDF